MSSPSTPQERLAVLRMLAAGKPPDFTAQALTVPADRVREIGDGHGWPDVKKLAWAADVLQEDIDAGAVTEIPPAQHQARVVADTAMEAVRRTPFARAQKAGQPFDATAALLLRASESPKHRTRALGSKISDLLVDLRDRLTQDDADHRKQQAAEMARRKAIEEVAAAEKALKEARDKLRRFKHHPGGNGPPKVRASRSETTPGQTTAASDSMREFREHQAAVLNRSGITVAHVRQWAFSDQVECPKKGPLPRRVLDAYEEAHASARAAS